MGTSVVCFDVVNSDGVAATQRCLLLDVMPDPAPTVGGFLGGRPLQESVSLYIGASYMFQVVAHDANTADTLTIMPSTADGGACTPPACLPLPPGAQLLGHELTHVVVGGGAMASVNVSFTALHNHGGYDMQHCFTASDACGGGCGGEECPGVVQHATLCFTVRVERCQFIVRQGQELQEIAAVYHSDWLQLWSHNQQLLSPDTHLMPGSVIAIGHKYAVQPFDKAADVAKRFGMSAEQFTTLNADMPPSMQGSEICTSVSACSDMHWCVLPSSCNGDSGSIYQGAYKDQPWFASAKNAVPGGVGAPSGA